MNTQAFEIIMALISIIAAIAGGTGATYGIKAKNKNKSSEVEIESLKNKQEFQEKTIKEIKYELHRYDQKLEKKITNIETKIDKIWEKLSKGGE